MNFSNKILSAFFCILVLTPIYGTLDVKLKDDEIALISAVLLREDKNVETLLCNGTNPNIKYLGEKLVHYAIRTNLIVALTLVHHGADFSGLIADSSEDAFTYVLTHNSCSLSIDLPLLKAFVEKGYDVKKNFNNKDLSNNAFYQAIILDKYNHLGYFLGWDGRMKNNDYISLQGADLNHIFVFPNGSTFTPLLLCLSLQRVGHIQSYVLKKRL